MLYTQFFFMKKLIPALSLMLILFACRKAEQTGQTEYDTTLHDVKFTVADFNVFEETMSASGRKTTMAVGDTLSNYADYLHYSVYNEAGFMVRYINQTKADKDFGTIKGRLANGNYSVVIAASKTTPLRFDTTGRIPFSVLTFGPNTKDGNWNDSFHKMFKITVADAPLTQTIKLDRLVGAFNVVIEDAIPADVSKIVVEVNISPVNLKLDGTLYSSLTSSYFNFPLLAADAGVKNKMFAGYIINTFYPVTVFVTAYNAKGVKVAQKSISSLTFSRGERITLTGSLFTQANTKSNSSLSAAETRSSGWTQKTTGF